MNDAPQKVTGLKKVTIEVEAGTTENEMDLTSGPQLYELVTGIGTGGFTPFEYALLDKQPGDIIQLKVRTLGREEMFGHIHMPLPPSAMALDSFFLNVTVKQIDDVDQTGLVQAMAGALKCCDGDCCGHH
jgi:hypothetical protein